MPFKDKKDFNTYQRNYKKRDAQIAVEVKKCGCIHCQQILLKASSSLSEKNRTSDKP
jgi:hypothetical protein